MMPCLLFLCAVRRTMPIPEVLFEEVRICAKKWKSIGEAMCHEMADAGALICSSILFEKPYADVPKSNI